MAIALNDTDALRTQGLRGLFSAFEHQGIEAPLVPLVTVPLHLVFGRGVDQSLLVLPLFFIGLVLVTYGIAYRVSTPRWATVAALTVATLPGVTDYTRLYHFALPATALLTAGLWALLQAEGLQRRGWVIGAGVCVGLMLLTRTMMLAYLPGFALAAMIQLVLGTEERRRRAGNLALGALAVGLIAGVWYVPNARAVGRYLIGSGYGAQSGAYGTVHPVLSWAFWTKEIYVTLGYLYLPLAVLLSLCLLASLFFQFRHVPWRQGLSYLRSQPLAQDILVLVVIVVEGYVALTSSTNQGTGFSLPWLPALVVLAVAATASLPVPRLRTLFGILFVVVSMLNLLMKSGFVAAVATPRTATWSPFGPVPILDGRGLIQLEVEGAGYTIGSPTSPFPPLERQWLPFCRVVAGWILHDAGVHHQRPVVLFGSDHLLFSDTRLELAASLWFHHPLTGGLLTPFPEGDRVEAYREAMSRAGNTFLVTSDHGPREDLPITRAKVEAAARSLGFAMVKTFRMPDGGRVWLWRR